MAIVTIACVESIQGLRGYGSGLVSVHRTASLLRGAPLRVHATWRMRTAPVWAGWLHRSVCALCLLASPLSLRSHSIHAFSLYTPALCSRIARSHLLEMRDTAATLLQADEEAANVAYQWITQVLASMEDNGGKKQSAYVLRTRILPAL